MQEFGRSLPMLLYRALDAVMPRFRRIFNDFGLTEQQWRVLRVLWDDDGIALRELSDRTLIPAPSLVGVVGRLGTQGLVARRRSDADRRVVFVTLTPSGRRLQGEVEPRVRQAYAELRDSMDAAEWRRLLSALEALAGTAAGLPTDSRSDGGENHD